MFSQYALRNAAQLSARRTFSTTPRASLAKMNIIGRLGAAPEAVNTSTGHEPVRYVLGVNTGRGENKKTNWFRVTSFDEGPRRQYLLDLPKGTLMHVEADASMSTYEDGGKNRSALNLTQRNIEVLSRPVVEAESGEGMEASQAAASG